MTVVSKPPTPAPSSQAGQAYAAPQKVHPRKVSGKYRSLKWWAMTLLLAYWHLAPLIRWDRGIGAPNQAILVDMAGRRAYFFFIEIWPQEVYYLTGLLFIAAISLTLYFGDAFEQLHDIFTGTASTANYGAIAVVGGFCFLLAGYAREQVCIYMCPYGRFQSAMFDEHSLIISYEAWRGEMRGPAPADHNFEGRGHCVDCMACVQVCPTGIDIRNGNQLACIGCGLCIDACNAVMDRFKLPRGLVSYDSVSNLAARGQGLPTKIRLIRPRTLIYGAILLVVGSVILVRLVSRPDTTVNVLHGRAPLFVQMSDGSIRNGYVYKVLNMSSQDRVYSLTLTGIEGATMDVVGGGANATTLPLAVAKDSVGTFQIFISAQPSRLADKKVPIEFVLTGPKVSVTSETLFAGPEK